MQRNINCIYFKDINTCTHPEKKWFFKLFNGNCYDGGCYSPCELREGYEKPDILPPAPPPPRIITEDVSWYDFTGKIKIDPIKYKDPIKFGNTKMKEYICEHCGKINKI